MLLLETEEKMFYVKKSRIFCLKNCLKIKEKIILDKKEMNTYSEVKMFLLIEKNSIYILGDTIFDF